MSCTCVSRRGELTMFRVGRTSSSHSVSLRVTLTHTSSFLTCSDPNLLCRERVSGLMDTPPPQTPPDPRSSLFSPVSRLTVSSSFRALIRLKHFSVSPAVLLRAACFRRQSHCILRGTCSPMVFLPKQKASSGRWPEQLSSCWQLKFFFFEN